MTSPIFIDSNVPMYAGGRLHPLKPPSLRVMELAGTHSEMFVTNAEVLQEILHRYLAQDLWARGSTVFAGFASLMRGRVEPVYAEDVEGAARLASEYPGLQARDLLHLAVMGRIGATRIVSADVGFSRAPHVERLDPATVSSWEADLT